MFIALSTVNPNKNFSGFFIKDTLQCAIIECCYSVSLLIIKFTIYARTCGNREMIDKRFIEVIAINFSPIVIMSG